MDWYLAAVRNYLGFYGRARRKEFWMFILCDTVIRLGLGIIEYLTHINILIGIYSVLVFLPYVAVSMRRLHDTNRTGWWLLLSFIPVIGFIVLLYFMVQEGDRGENRFGPNPKF